MCQQLYTTAMAMVVNIGHKGCKGPREHAMGCCFIWLTAGAFKKPMAAFKTTGLGPRCGDKMTYISIISYHVVVMVQESVLKTILARIATLLRIHADTSAQGPIVGCGTVRHMHQ